VDPALKVQRVKYNGGISKRDFMVVAVREEHSLKLKFLKRIRHSLQFFRKFTATGNLLFNFFYNI
jgi:hypothetical protein